MKNIELDMIVKDSLAALEAYRSVFEINTLQETSYDRGMNEVIFSIYDFTIHLLDENSDYGLVAPQEDQIFPFWINVTVTDIRDTYDKALAAGFTEIQAITKLPDFGVSNAVIKDPFGYQWMLHEVHEEKSPEELERIMNQKFNN